MQKKMVEKHVLKNGLNLLICPLHTSPQVSLQMWYNVGSKYEKTGQHGLAHFFEHMIFKGTEQLSELDISLIVNKLSGSCNAFTAQDYTAYVYEVPSQHWYEVLPLFVECMTKASCKEELIHAELKTVVQELKMYRDDYETTLFEEMLAVIFPGHPYHYPIIGYKGEIWNFTRPLLLDFYKMYYAPNNATLVVVGDVAIEDVVQKVSVLFDNIPTIKIPELPPYGYTQDTAATSVTLYRDVQQPVAQYGFVIPGIRAQQDHYAQALALLLCNGRGSRLYKKLVDELQIAVDIEATIEEMFDYSVFFITVYPKDVFIVPRIEQEIIQELNAVHVHGFLPEELQRAQKKIAVEHLLLFEMYEQLAYEIGKCFVATGDERYITDFVQYTTEQNFAQHVHDYCAHYLRPLVMHKGFIFPLSDEEKTRWLVHQEREDEADELVSEKFTRTVPLEQGRYVAQVIAQEPCRIHYPKSKSFVLSSGLRVFVCDHGDMPMIELAIDFQAKTYFDPEKLQGLSLFLSKMMLEGTEHYTCQQLADAFESHGIIVNILPGFISLMMLRDDFEYGCTLLHEILTASIFTPEAIEKVRKQILAELDDFWNEPSQFSVQLVREKIYQGHPYAKNGLGTKEAITKITRGDLLSAYQQFITPHGANMAVVGAIKSLAVDAILQKTVGRWYGSELTPLQIPEIMQPHAQTMTFQLHRDQATLTYAGLSLARTDKDYDKLLLFDQIFTGSASGSMNSRLFQLREETGFFYTIGGSLVAGATDQPGMIFVTTMVSLDSLYDAEKVIERAFETATVGVTPQEFVDAKNWLLHSFSENIDTNTHMARTILFLAHYNLPETYFDERMNMITSLSLDDVLSVARKIVRPEVLIKLRVGRV
jgi:zinc protease